MSRQGPSRTDRLVVAAAIVDDVQRPRHLLAARRNAPPDLAGGWEFPGGKVEAGESPIVALRRELREELSVTVVLGSEVVGPVDGCWPLMPGLRMRVWWATVADGTPAALADHDALCWLAPGSWHNVAWLPADVAVVTTLAEQAAESAEGRGVH